MLFYKTSDNTKTDKVAEKLSLSNSPDGNTKWYSHSKKEFGSFF